jgi:hypothetical protein
MKTKRRKIYKNKKTFRKKKRKQSYKKKIFRKQSYKKKSFKGGNGDATAHVPQDDPTGENKSCETCERDLEELKKTNLELVAINSELAAKNLQIHSNINNALARSAQHVREFGSRLSNSRTPIIQVQPNRRPVARAISARAISARSAAARGRPVARPIDNL